MNNRRVFIGVFASLLFFYLIFWIPRPGLWLKGDLCLLTMLFGQARIDFGNLWQTLLHIKIIPLIVCFLITPLHVLIRSYRWILLIKPIGKLKIYDSYSIQMVSYFTSATMPLRIGEVVKGVLLSRQIQTSKSTALATVVLERLIDIICMMILVVLVGFLYSFPTEIKNGIIFLNISIGIGVLVLFYFTLAKDPFDNVIGNFLRIIPGGLGSKLIGIIIRFTRGFAALKSRKDYLFVIIESISLWILYGLQHLLIIYAFHFHIDYSFIAASPLLVSFILLAINSAGLSIPSAPGGVGTFHAVCIFSLALFGVGADPAAGFALVIHATTYLFYIFCGIPFMIREGLKIGHLRQMRLNNG
ncbi:MAG: lysylphosphatidylglycerol synthase transmembrane domain-containing protein [Candidatus Hatepunaea meridiana]|nr:lysylphosphatidylglycerol synthase transmembrane domain-containing protein [Candidatus Hatepunaea meridiana]